jgi:FkbM family methyltransferase
MADLRACYRLFLDRSPDAHGMNTYSPRVRRLGVSVEDLVSWFVSSPEFRARLPRLLGEADSPVERVELSEGFPLYFRREDPALGASVRASREYEPHVVASMKSLLPVGGTLVDVGASVGFHTVLGGRIVGPTGRVVAFEPSYRNLSLLLLNLHANALENVELHQLAASDRPGLLWYGGTGSNGRVTSFDGDASRLAYNDLVRSDTLDRVLAREPRVDVLKVDVEGAEGLVLRGARDLLARCRPHVLLEFSPPSLEASSGESGGQLLEYLSALGYALTVLSPGRLAGRTVSIGQVVDCFATGSVEHLDLLASPS